MKAHTRRTLTEKWKKKLGKSAGERGENEGNISARTLNSSCSGPCQDAERRVGVVRSKVRSLFLLSLSRFFSALWTPVIRRHSRHNESMWGKALLNTLSHNSEFTKAASQQPLPHLPFSTIFFSSFSLSFSNAPKLPSRCSRARTLKNVQNFLLLSPKLLFSCLFKFHLQNHPKLSFENFLIFDLSTLF